MKPLNEIIEECTDEDGVVHIDAAIPMIAEAIEQSGVPQTPGDNIAAFIAAQRDVNIYLGRIVLEVADEVNALPNGYDEEFNTLVTYLDFTILSALYQQVAQRKAAMSGLTIVSGEHPPIDGLV